MHKTLPVVAAAALGLSVLAGGVFGQGVPQPITKVDVLKISTGYRTSKINGSSVVNENNDTIGKIDDVIIAPAGGTAYAVISVGGFLGVGSKLVAVPFSNLSLSKDHIMLSGATKEELKSLPEFNYATD